LLPVGWLGPPMLQRQTLGVASETHAASPPLCKRGFALLGWSDPRQQTISLQRQ
jgi:hypothetical protein